MNPQKAPEFVKNRFKNGSKTCSFLYLIFGSSWNSSDASWEPSGASQGCLGKPQDPKTLKTEDFLRIFGNAVFCCLGALDGSPRAVLARPGPILDPKWTPKKPQKEI